MMYTLKDVREAALAALAEAGDHVYESPVGDTGNCLYSTQGGQPSCIVGHVFARIDEEMFSLRHDAEWATEKPYSTSVGLVLGGLNMAYTALAADWLAEAQDMQDQGRLWSIAIERADGWVIDQRYRAEPEEVEYLDKIQAEREAS